MFAVVPVRRRRLASLGCGLVAAVLLAAVTADARSDGDSAADPARVPGAPAELTAAAKGGDAQAQHDLGTLYRRGDGVRRHYGWAAVWYLKSARQGYAPAQANLAVLREAGLGLTRNLERAAHWYRKAAEQGHAFAQANLGRLYARGLGVERNLVLAYRWSYLARSRTADPRVRNRLTARLDRLAARMNAEQMAQAEWRIRQWRPGLP